MDKIIDLFKGRWKVFLLSLGIQFIITFLLHAGLQAPQQLHFLSIPGLEQTKESVLNNPSPEKIDIFETIKPKLNDAKNLLHLQKQSGLVTTTYAAGNFDQASSYLAVDLSNGEVLADKDSAARFSIASLTKIMTAVVALDLARSDDRFIVSSQAAGVEPTSIGVVPGESMTLEELLHAALMTSANDAVQVIKEGIDHKFGSDVFVRAMNEKARILGLKNTHFANPQGFDDPNNYSSAEDLAVLSDYALKNYPLIASIAQKDYQLLPADTYHKRFDLYNWNGLLDVYPGIEGLKIGNTDAAGTTMVAVSERDNKKVLSVLLGAPGVLERDLWNSELLDAGFEKLGLPRIDITPAQLRAKYSTWKYWN